MLLSPPVREESCGTRLRGLSRVTKGVYGPMDFDSISHLLSKVSSYERLHPDLYAEKPRKLITNFQTAEEESADEADVAMV